MFALFAFALIGLDSGSADDVGNADFFSCPAVQDWVRSVAVTPEAFQVVHWQWPRSEQGDSIPVYAAMSGWYFPEQDAMPSEMRELYSGIAQSTHYRTLDDFAVLFADCVDAEVAFVSDVNGHRTSLSASAVRANAQIDVYWSRNECGFGYDGFQDVRLGCASFRVRATNQ